RFDPLSIRVENLEVSSAPEKPSFFKAQNASAVIPFESLWGNEFVVTEASVDSPEINLNELPAFPKKSEQQTNQTRFRVESFRVTSGVVQIRDYKVQGIDLLSQINSDGVNIAKLNAQCLGIALSANGSMKNWSEPDLNFRYNTNGDLSQVAE